MALFSVVTNFSTTLAQSMTSTQGTMVLTSVTIQGHALTSADYGAYVYFTINPGASNMEVVRASTNTGTTFTLDKRGLSWYGDADTELSAYKFAHNAGEPVIISDVKNVFDRIVDTVSDETISGIKTFTSSPIVPTPTSSELSAAASVEFVNNTAIAGAPNASTVNKGIVQAATQAQMDARTTTGSTGALLFPTLDVIRATKYSDYAVDSVGTDSYAITVTPAITAYAAGQVFVFKAGTANTNAATLNVSGLGAKTIKKDVSSDLATGDILANQDVMVIYDGTNFQLLSGLANLGQKIQNSEYVYAADSVGTDSYAITLVPAPSAYATGQRFIFKAGTANTDACTLNVNGLGAKTIKKNYNEDTVTGDIVANQIVQVCYDGTNFQMMSPALTNAQNTFSVMAGQTLDANDCTIIGDGTTVVATVANYNSSSGANIDVGANSGSQKASQEFSGGTDIFVSQIQTNFTKVGTPADNWTLSIQTDNAGNPSGSVVSGATVTKSGGSISTGVTTWSLPSIVALPNAKYHVVLERSGAVDGSNYLNWSADTAVSPKAKTYDGTTWSASAARSYTIVSLVNVAGYAFKSDEDAAALRNPVVGFATAKATGLTPANIMYSGKLAGFTSLTVGKPYYTSSTPGAIATSGTTKVGTSVSASELMIQI